MTDQNGKIKDLKNVYELAIESRNFEISQLIQRNNFIMLFQGVLLASVFQNQASKPYVEFTICFFGIIISWYQIKVAAGAKYWQEVWEIKLAKIEEKLKELITVNEGREFEILFSFAGDEEKEEVRKRLRKHKGLFGFFINNLIINKFSVSRTPIAVGIALFSAWFILWAQCVNPNMTTFVSGHNFSTKPAPKAIENNDASR